jgi:hypothetical protein
MKVSLKAIQDQRIRIDGIKEDVKKGTIVEVEKSEVPYFLAHNFVIAKDVVKKNEIQTTDASDKKVVKKRGVKKK